MLGFVSQLIVRLCDATDTEIENHQLMHMAALAQIDAGVSLTGSIGDAWAAAEGGWKLIDINAETIREGVLWNLQAQTPMIGL